MSLLKSMYNVMYKMTNKAQNEPKNVFSDIEVEVQKNIAVDGGGVCTIDLWTPKERADKLPVMFYTQAGVLCRAANTMSAGSPSGSRRWDMPLSQ